MSKGLKNILNFFSRKSKAWSDFEYFDDSWNERVDQMATFIPKGNSVLDLGCGQMHLLRHVAADQYHPVDYKNRGNNTIICDFNKEEFPAEAADVAFVSGCLEYVINYEWFIGKIAVNAKRAILSYCTTDEFAELKERNRLGWVNHLSKAEIIRLFTDRGFLLKELQLTDSRNQIFVFDKSSN